MATQWKCLLDFDSRASSFQVLLHLLGFVLRSVVLQDAAGFGQVAVLLPFLPPLHMYRQLRGAYGLGRWGALWRTFGLLVASILVLTIFIILMVGLGVMH